MAYSTGILRHRITILNKQVSTSFGDTTTYIEAGVVSADITWNKGVKALREGSLDSMDTVMIRMRYNSIVTRESRLRCGGVTYQIQSMHSDYQQNTIQITATEIL